MKKAIFANLAILAIMAIIAIWAILADLALFGCFSYFAYFYYYGFLRFFFRFLEFLNKNICRIEGNFTTLCHVTSRVLVHLRHWSRRKLRGPWTSGTRATAPNGRAKNIRLRDSAKSTMTTNSQCLKITEKVSFNILSEVY